MDKDIDDQVYLSWREKGREMMKIEGIDGRWEDKWKVPDNKGRERGRLEAKGEREEVVKENRLEETWKENKMTERNE